ncbi:HEAT repeat domain-containing protein, partial [bacterium]|nr:HEAT repeat domain-containing protein [bacterium]
MIGLGVGFWPGPARADQIDDLVRGLGSTNEEIRAESADLLARIGGPRVERQFRRMLASSSPEHRQMAVAGLLQTSDIPEDLDRVRARLEQDDNSGVRWTAALALGQAGWPEAAPWLRAATTNDRSELVREAAADAVAHLQGVVPWRRTVSAALREARELGKPVLVYFTLRGSEYCRRLDQAVLADRSVVDALQEFVPVRLDAARPADEAPPWDLRPAPT